MFLSVHCLEYSVVANIPVYRISYYQQLFKNHYLKIYQNTCMKMVHVHMEQYQNEINKMEGCPITFLGTFIKT